MGNRMARGARVGRGATTWIAAFLLPGALGGQTTDVVPGATPEWQGYAVRWGQVVTENGVRRPGINTIYDTLAIRMDDGGTSFLHRKMVWRDIHGAWLAIATEMTPGLLAIRRTQSDDRGDVEISEWLPEGPVRTTIFDADSSHARTETVGVSRSAPRGFAPMLYGLHFRLAGEISRGSILEEAGTSGAEAGWTEFKVEHAGDLPNLVGLDGPYRVVRTGTPGSMQTEFWLTERAPYVARVRFEQANGVITEWVMTALERFE